VTVGGGVVEVDVMDLSDNPLPRDIERRAFALARRFVLSSARLEQVVVVESDGAVVAIATIPVATATALVALKTVSMVRRPHGNHPTKVGSDIHDLVRIVRASGARSIARDLVSSDAALASWVAQEIERAFGNDLRYTLVRPAKQRSIRRCAGTERRGHRGHDRPGRRDQREVVGPSGPCGARPVTSFDRLVPAGCPLVRSARHGVAHPLSRHTTSVLLGHV
jgi:hypothetical protein